MRSKHNERSKYNKKRQLHTFAHIDINNLIDSTTRNITQLGIIDRRGTEFVANSAVWKQISLYFLTPYFLNQNK